MSLRTRIHRLEKRTSPPAKPVGSLDSEPAGTALAETADPQLAAWLSDPRLLAIISEMEEMKAIECQRAGHSPETPPIGLHVSMLQNDRYRELACLLTERWGGLWDDAYFDSRLAARYKEPAPADA
jgi:hypothetical protein